MLLANFTHEYGYKNTKQNITKSDSVMYAKDTFPLANLAYPGNVRMA